MTDFGRLDSGPNNCEGHYSMPFQNPHFADSVYTTTVVSVVCCILLSKLSNQ